MTPSPEFHLFCLALRRPLSDDDRAAIRTMVAAEPRWEAILDGARRHAVAPLLLTGLRKSDAAISSGILDELRRAAATAARRSLVQSAALASLVQRFDVAGIKLLVLKGAPLSQLLYGDTGQRSAQDIDLLVAPVDMTAAEALLAETGHRRVGAALPDSRRRWFKEVEYVHPAHGRVELHHRLTDLTELAPWDFATLWRERDTIMLGNTAIPALGRRHLACYLCAHGAEHAWQRLRWLTDLAVLLRAPGELDAALATAQDTGLDAALLHAVLLAHDWLGLPVPAAMLTRARADRRVARLDRILAHSYSGELWHAMPAPSSFDALLRYSLWQRLYRLSIKPVWRYRLHLLRRELVSPADWAALPLPDRLAWLYPLIRPFGWLLRRRPG